MAIIDGHELCLWQDTHGLVGFIHLAWGIPNYDEGTAWDRLRGHVCGVFMLPVHMASLLALCVFIMAGLFPAVTK
jgi:hypothetical protein